MSKRVAWWLVGITMLVVSVLFGSLQADWRRPTGIVIGFILGAGLALVIVPLLVGLFTRFRSPLAVGAVFGFVALVGFIGVFSPSATAAPEVYLQQTVRSAQSCQTAGRNLVGCYVDASPKRCEQQTIEYVQQPSGNQMRTWALCVESCADAGVMSSHFGECRRQMF